MVSSLLVGAFLSYALLMLAQVMIRPVRLEGFVWSFVVLLGLAILASLNLQFGIFEQKLASELAFEWYSGNRIPLNRAFALQAVANAPSFFIANTWHAAIGTNVAVTAATCAFLYDSEKKSHLYFLGPATVNFAIFALRDPFIGLIFFALVLAIGQRFEVKRLVVPTLVAGVAMYFTRPENILIILALAWFLSFRSSNTALAKFFMVAAGVVGALAALRLGPALLGAGGDISIGNLPGFFAEFSEARATRTTRTGVGGGSDILGGALARLPIFVRYPLQLLTFFVLPLPFEIRSFALLLAAFDSCFFAYSSRKLFREGSKPAKVIFVVYVLVTAFFSSNYGNVLRIRYPLYFVIGAGLFVGSSDESPNRSELSSEISRSSSSVS